METAYEPIRRWVALLALTFMMVVLTGCAGMRIVDTDVRAFAAEPGVQVPATYRFERLPLQQRQGEFRDWLETITQAELTQVGMQRDDVAPQYSVMIDLRMARDPRAPWDDAPFWGGFYHRNAVVLPSGAVVYVPTVAMQFDTPYYRREVHLLVRRLSDGMVVFESRANHDGRWSDDRAVLPAMLEAALRGFPNPPQGLRRVDIEIPR